MVSHLVCEVTAGMLGQFDSGIAALSFPTMEEAMIISPYRTQYTRMMQDGDKNPTRSDVNRKALERPARKAAWEARKNASN
jgi:hypothetical protein